MTEKIQEDKIKEINADPFFKRILEINNTSNAINTAIFDSIYFLHERITELENNTGAKKVKKAKKGVKNEEK